MKGTAERLTKGMLKDVQLLTDNHAIQSATGDEVRQPSESIHEAASSPLPSSSLANDVGVGIVYSYGTNVQTNINGSGIQNNSFDQQFNGTFQAWPNSRPSI